MKIVINNCFGGFGLSAAAVKRFAELSGFKIYGYQYDRAEFRKTVRWSGDPDEFIIHWLKQDLGDNPSEAELNDAEWLHERDIPRDNKILVQVIEELGAMANSRCADLKVVEIPDGTEYEISEYDGNEHIAEKHRTWS